MYRLILALLFVLPAAGSAFAEDAALVAPDRILHVCVEDYWGMYWNLSVNNQSPYTITGTLTNTGCQGDATVSGRATGKNGSTVAAQTTADVTDPYCCDFTANWTMDTQTRTGSYTWTNSCGYSGGPDQAWVVPCTMALKNSAPAGPLAK